MRKGAHKGILIVGANSLLTVYAILCLVIFALLSLNTVQAQKRMADAAVSADSEYYAADCQAQRILARLRNGEDVENVIQEGNIYRYECMISEAQRLMVEVECLQDEWKILRWQAVGGL